MNDDEFITQTPKTSIEWTCGSKDLSHYFMKWLCKPKSENKTNGRESILKVQFHLHFDDM